MKRKFNKGFAGIVPVIVVGLLLFISCVVYFGLLRKGAVVNVPSVKVTVAGSGSASFALGNWAKYYEAKNPNVKFEFLPSADAAVGIRGVKEKTLDIGVTSRKAKSEEEFSEMVTTKFVKDAVVFVVNKSVTEVTNLTAAQLANIYTGKTTNWREVGGPNAKILVVDREEAESSKKLFRDLYLGKKTVASDVTEVHSEKDVLLAVVSTPSSIGYLSYGRAKTADVNVLSLNGVNPVNGVVSGTYSMVRDYYIFTRVDSNQEVKDFVSFMTSQGMSLVGSFNYFKP